MPLESPVAGSYISVCHFQQQYLFGLFEILWFILSQTSEDAFGELPASYCD